jgi:2-dehydropantoate 2-reductase
VPDILTYVWAKVIYNCALNAICSLEEIPYGKILENPKTRQRMEKVIQECYEVGKMKGIILNPPNAEGFIELMIKKLIPSTAAHIPSMLQDLRRNKRTDIQALNGAMSRYGQELGIATPENALLVQQISELQNAFLL